MRRAPVAEKDMRYCSFCGKSEHECIALILGPNWNFICDWCIAMSAAIIVKKHPTYYAKVIIEMDAALKEATLTESKGGSE